MRGIAYVEIVRTAQRKGSNVRIEARRARRRRTFSRVAGVMKRAAKRGQFWGVVQTPLK